MPTQRKIFTVQNLTQKLKDAKSLILADYRGLPVAQINELRHQAKEAGGELEVVKNRLLKIAAKQANIKLDEKALTGPTVALWAWEDEIAPLKVMAKFTEEFGLPKAKSGLFEGAVISSDKIDQLTKIQSREAIHAKLVGILSSPSYGLVNSLQWNLKKLVYVLNAKAKKTT